MTTAPNTSSTNRSSTSPTDPPAWQAAAADIDYSLYLVTGRGLLPEGKDYYESLEESLRGGVTIVQVREKDVDTGEFLEIARRTKEITDKYSVPLLINDRLDIALAIGAAGLHVGQSDLPPATARRLLPPGAILGLSVSNVDEARRAARDAAAAIDYVGVGAVWETQSKDVTGKVMLGPEGVGEVLDVLAEEEKEAGGRKMATVAIGGIHLPNLPHLLHASVSPRASKRLDGIALISDIVASRQPERAARALRDVLDASERRHQQEPTSGVFSGSSSVTSRSAESLVRQAVELLAVVRERTPLAHQMTNNVVANDSANATLALGASPIMATHPLDVVDLSPAIAALLVNFGTISDKQGMIVAGQAANRNRKPIVFDPVAVGATKYRADTAKELMDAWQPTIIKGNAGEIASLAKSTEVKSRGVDSVGAGFKDTAQVLKALAKKKRCIVAMTGKDDYVTDGETVVQMSNGHELLGSITGSGCMTGSCVTIFAGAASLSAADAEPSSSAATLVNGDMFAGAVAGILAFNVAAEFAAERADTHGPTTFRSALIDELYNLTGEKIVERAKVQIIT